MKTSEVLKAALLFYRNPSFMCNVVGDMEGQAGSPVTPAIVVQVERAIHRRLDGWFTLDSYLKETDLAYRVIRVESGGWTDDRLHKIRIAFWYAFITELEAKGE